MADTGGSSFPTTPVAPSQGNRPWLVAGLVVALMAGSFAIARLTPDPAPDPKPPAEAIRATPAATPVEPVATALPLREWFSALEAPIDDIFVEAGAVRRLRLAGPRLTDEALAQPGRDLLLRSVRGGTICLCWQPAGTESGDPRALDLVSLDSDLRERSRTTVTTAYGLDLAGRLNGSTQVALEPSPDGRFAYLARISRAATQLQIGLDTIDLATASIVDSADLVPVPQVDRSEASTVEQPILRIAPDGRHAVVLSAIHRERSLGPLVSARHAWIIGLDGPTLGRIVAADAIADVPSEDCSWIGFVTATIVARGCRFPIAASSTSFEVRRYDLTGRNLGPSLADPSQAGADEPLLDMLAGVGYAWDPIGNTLLAADLVRGRWRTAGSSSADLDNPDTVVIDGPRPPPGPSTIWSDGRPATDTPRVRTLAGSPDGRLLFAIGAGSRSDSSSGIWVFDSRTLQLIERWPALADYESVTLFEDGRWLAAIGRPGSTATGGPAEWGTSVTIHDTTTGRPVLRIGDLGTAGQVTFPRLGPLVATP